MKTISYFFLFFAISASLTAQDIAVSYEITPQNENQATMQVYLQSLTDQDHAIRAINLSLALPEGCVKIADQSNVFVEAWTEFLQEVKVNDQVDLSYNSWHYTQRWQYGNADPGLPNTAPIIAPAQDNPPLQVMNIKLEGSCIDRVYLEEQAENRVNQMGDEDILPIAWTVIHPKTELELEPGLRLEIFPNPVVNMLHVQTVGQHDNHYLVELLSVEGKRLFHSELGEENEIKVDMTKQAAAVYILSITNLNSSKATVSNLKIIKK